MNKCIWCKKPLAETADMEEADKTGIDRPDLCWRIWNEDEECYIIEERIKDATPFMLDALEKLVVAAQRRENPMGDPSALIAAKASLADAVSYANEIIQSLKS